MKRLFTLFAVALVCSSMFGQAKWKDLVVNGNMEGEQDPKWSSFWCHDWRRGLGDFDPESEQKYDNNDPEMGQFQGFAEIIEDPVEPGNHCARVVARSEAEADEAGNKVKPDGGSNLAEWDCQFFVYATDTIPEGKELRMTLRVRADKAGSFQTQAHWKPGDYNYWSMFGDVNVTTEWQKIEVTAAIGFNQAHAENGDGSKHMQSVAFNLSTNTAGNTFYFDDIKLEVRDTKKPAEFEGWFNMLRHGTLSNDKIGAYTTFTGHDATDGKTVQARLVDDPLDGQPALTVNGVAPNWSIKVPVLDDEGNPVLDDDGNPTFDEKSTYVRAPGDTLRLNNGSGDYGIDEWTGQFFVTVPHKFAADSKYRLVMWARADKPATVQTQAHKLPTDYIHYEMLGDLNLTTEWQPFEFEGEITSQQSSNGTMQTIAFNCNVLKEDNNYYFRFEEFSANAADVSDEERTLGSEDVKLLLPSADQADGATGTIDFTKCKEVLEYESFETLVGDNMSAQMEDETFGYVDPSAGCPLTDEGWLAEEESNLAIEMDEVTDDDTALTLYVYNLGLPEDIKTVNSKFRFSYNNWFYIYNVSFQSADIFDGIEEVKAQPAAAKTDVIYDLSGRRVKNMGKGIYIINGKKYIK